MFLCIACSSEPLFHGLQIRYPVVSTEFCRKSDILFEYSTDGAWKEVKPDSTDIFGTDNLWSLDMPESHICVLNAGSLALKYSLIVDHYQEMFRVSTRMGMNSCSQIISKLEQLQPYISF